MRLKVLISKIKWYLELLIFLFMIVPTSSAQSSCSWAGLEGTGFNGGWNPSATPSISGGLTRVTLNAAPVAMGRLSVSDNSSGSFNAENVTVAVVVAIPKTIYSDYSANGYTLTTISVNGSTTPAPSFSSGSIVGFGTKEQRFISSLSCVGGTLTPTFTKSDSYDIKGVFLVKGPVGSKKWSGSIYAGAVIFPAGKTIDLTDIVSKIKMYRIGVEYMVNVNNTCSVSSSNLNLDHGNIVASTSKISSKTGSFSLNCDGAATATLSITPSLAAPGSSSQVPLINMGGNLVSKLTVDGGGGQATMTVNNYKNVMLNSQVYSTGVVSLGQHTGSAVAHIDFE